MPLLVVMVVGAVWASEVLVALVQVTLLQFAVELRLTPSVSDVTGGTSVVDASVVEPSVVDASVVEASVVEASVVEASVVEASVVEASVVEGSVVEGSVVEASEVEAVSALEVVRVVAEYVLASEVVEAVDDSMEAVELEATVVSVADVTTELLLEGCGQTPPLL